MPFKYSDKLGQIIAIIGMQYGDEGKGKLVDILSNEYDYIVRPTGGANAGHTIWFNNKKFVFHQIPSGMLHPEKIGIISNGGVIHIPMLFEEIQFLKNNNIDINGRLFISERAHITTEYHRAIDVWQENQRAGKKIGTTKKGIGPSYTDKVNRIGLRIGELLKFDSFKEHYLSNAEMLKKMYNGLEIDTETELKTLQILAEQLRPMIVDTTELLHTAFEKGQKILMEGANGTLLDVDHGAYPYVTSSNASIGGVIAGSGIPPQYIKSCIGVLKAYTTRVGEGPFPTELKEEIGEQLRQKGGEFGSTTGRPRRCGWFDAVVARYTAKINGITSVNLTKLDVLSGLKEVKIATNYAYHGKPITFLPSSLDILAKVEVRYEILGGWNESLESVRSFEELPKAAQTYVNRIQELISCPIEFIGVGNDRSSLIYPR